MDALLAWRRTTEEKGRTWPFLSIFFLILVLHLVAILLFARGFLLTRTELPYYSNCSDISQSPCFQPPHSLPLSDKRDTPRRHPNLKSCLKVLHKLASREGSSARIFKAIANPPTHHLTTVEGTTFQVLHHNNSIMASPKTDSALCQSLEIGCRTKPRNLPWANALPGSLLITHWVLIGSAPERELDM
ncbi:hypothetical protein Acr_22g0009260 [Actinidia rufa]|uniref:Uncharacterized protein n=1 Tax=Actinidia rufa TaxID=165716 RepID=A0A7J0GLB9_9ERIC|nr:hypothetical protein Acr_22g0009260 [Actinidia rufa]